MTENVQIDRVSALSLVSRIFHREALIIGRQPESLISHVHNRLFTVRAQPAVHDVLAASCKNALAGRCWMSLENRPAAAANPELVRSAELGGAHALDRLNGGVPPRFEGGQRLAVSASGDHVASISADGRMRIWDLKRWRRELEFPCRAWDVVWSSATRLIIRDSTRVWARDLADGSEEQLVEYRGREAALSADGRLLLVARDHSVDVWDLGSARLEPRSRALECRGPLSVSPDGTMIAAGRNESSGCIFELGASGPRAVIEAPGRAIVRMYEGDTNAVVAIAWSPDGECLAFGFENGLLSICRASGDVIAVVDHHVGSIMSLAWSPDARYLASASLGGQIYVWDAVERTLASVLHGHPTGVVEVAWLPDGGSLISADQSSVVMLWEPIRGGVNNDLGAEWSSIRSLAWSPDGNQYVSGGQRGLVQIWDGYTGAIERNLGGHEGLGRMAFGASEAGEGPPTSVPADPAAARRELEEIKRVIRGGASAADVRAAAKRLDELVQPFLPELDKLLSDSRAPTTGLPVDAVCWSPIREQIASAGHDKTLRLWDAHGLVEHVLVHELAVSEFVWSPDGALIASASDHFVRVWSVVSGELIAQIPAARSRALAWSPDGQWLAYAADDDSLALASAPEGSVASLVPERRVAVWHRTDEADANLIDRCREFAKRLREGALLRSEITERVRALEQLSVTWAASTHQSNSLTAATWSRDGHCVVAGTADGRLVFIDVATRTSSITVAGHPAAVNALHSSIDGLLASVDAEGTCLLWQPPELEPRGSVEVPRRPDAPIAISWSRRGDLVAISASHNAIEIWDGRRGALVARARCISPVLAAQFDDDGHTLHVADSGYATGNQPIPYVFTLRTEARA